MGQSWRAQAFTWGGAQPGHLAARPLCGVREGGSALQQPSHKQVLGPGDTAEAVQMGHLCLDTE